MNIFNKINFVKFLFIKFLVKIGKKLKNSKKYYLKTIPNVTCFHCTLI